MTEHNNVTISRELLRQVLDALEAHADIGIKSDKQISALRTALEQPEVEPVAWTPVANCLPASGVVVLACYRNRLGNLRRIRAEWVAAKMQEANGSDECECAEYDEATDTFYTAQGWYERIDNWGDYSSVAVTEGEVTHWMPLPPAPDAAPQAQQPPRIGSGVTVEQTLEQWEHDFHNPMTPEQQAEWVKREREFAARQAQQPAPVQEPVMDRESSWFALVMTAAAELEDASNCLRDPDAKRTATRGAEYYRNAAKVMSKAQQPRKAVKLTTDEYTALAHRIASKYTHRSDPAFTGYTFLPHTLAHFVDAVQDAVLKKNGVTE